MASEQVLEVPMRRHVFDSERPFDSVLDGIFGGISQPDIGQLFSKLAASTSYEQFSSLVRQAQGSTYVRVQVLTNAGALCRDKQLAAVRQLTDLIATAAGDSSLTERTWVC